MSDIGLKNLQEWYKSQCDGDWEHQYGIKIDTIDNPGWSVEIDLADTSLASKSLAEHKEQYGHEADWYTCKKEGLKFIAHGGPDQLGNIISFFLKWTTS